MDFSLSGIKTAVLYYINKHKIDPSRDIEKVKDIAAGFQQAVVEVLVHKTILAAQQQQVEHVLLSGGVACNSQLRQQLQLAATENNFKLYYPSPAMCTDNAAMIGSLGYYRYQQGERADWDLNARSSWPL